MRKILAYVMHKLQRSQGAACEACWSPCWSLLPHPLSRFSTTCSTNQPSDVALNSTYSEMNTSAGPCHARLPTQTNSSINSSRNFSHLGLSHPARAQQRRRTETTPPTCSAAAVADRSAAAQSPGGAVMSQLVGKKVLKLSPGLSTVPLLHPTAHNLPFAASLQIYSSAAADGSSSAASTSSSSRQQGAVPHVTDTPLVELHYVISGKGFFSSAASGVQQPLWAGDSIISMHGAATFAAGRVPDATQQQQQQQQGAPGGDTAQQQQQPQGSSPAWTNLLGWLQQLHSKQQQQHQAPHHSTTAPAADVDGTTAQPTNTTTTSSSSSDQLVMLQLLLPSELLTGEMLQHHAGHAHAVAQQLPWLPASLHPACAGMDLTPAGSIHQAQVCGLLVDAGLGQQPAHAGAVGQQPAQQQLSHQDDPPSAGRNEEQHHVSGADETASGTATSDSTASSNGNGSSGGGGSSGPVHTFLPSLSQQRILKRALSEVGAFRLPQQTNRLALLFGPHSSPAVCCSFGVEVFEPGHVTPLHIHSTAHELFFVLAGKGEAVFRTAAAAGGGGDAAGDSGGVQRVVMSPGDVAVFAPGVVHGVDNPADSQLYCLQMMLPNEFFVEWVRSGEEAGSLDVTALQRLAAAASCG